MSTRRLALAALLALPLACAPLIDFGALTGGDAGGDARAEADRDAGADTADATTAPDGADASQATDALDAIADAGLDVDDPCSSVPGEDNGVYCGTSHENGFTGGATNTLYECADGQVALTNQCSSDPCIVDPAGYPDTCDECSTKPDGTWCGSEFAGYVAILGNVKFTCTARKNSGIPFACVAPMPRCLPEDGSAACGP